MPLRLRGSRRLRGRDDTENDEGRHPAGRRPSGIRDQALAVSFGLRTKSVSVCSSSMPFVSGMRSST